jgi:SsrA-binding protein
MSAEEKIIVKNRQAFFDYEIVQEFEAGIALLGGEVKSVRAGRVSIKEAYGRPRKGELFLVGMHIAPYESAGFQHPEPTRPRRLLLHRREIRLMISKVEERGMTLVPLKIYLKNGRVKVQLALVRGKSKYDRREEVKRRDMDLDIQRELKERSRE